MSAHERYVSRTPVSARGFIKPHYRSRVLKGAQFILRELTTSSGRSRAFTGKVISLRAFVHVTINAKHL